MAGLGKILLIVALCYVGILLFLYLMQGSMIYFPVAEYYATPARVGLKYHEVTLKTSDGVKLSAWYIPAAPAAWSAKPSPRA